ncbi:proline-rich receptor-like protein kinase PERK2 [Alnus glutinosa]|uniref:proline-rich receptor-like protein kinase PERK2 n=1 Tax=Alnus glutinosa TaxID=3517 RepID=UPI002D79B9BC|nr:proline-rich receptor-like protein kinase PERK2 [Alnus glutinosa]
MAELAKFCLALLLAFSLLGFSVPQQSPYTSPSPAPELGADSSPPPPLVPVASPASPPSTSSPPALSPEDLPPGSPPTPSPSPSTSTHPGPAPSAVSDLGHVSADGGVHEGNGSSEGMSGAKKGGIAIGVILAAGLVVVGGFVYKKRRDNIRRTQYGYAARREIL